MEPLRPNETRLIGEWIWKGDRIVGDNVCKRIDALLDVLVKVATDDSGWFTLYQDPNDLRLWERSYPQGEYHGGGPPSLTVISKEDAQKRYKFVLEEPT